MSASITSWKSLKNVIHPTVLKAVDRFNFQEMTAVQTACIPQLVNYKDVAAEAVTGSGKTLAFLVPVLHLLMRREEEWKPHEIGAVIIAPTRELAHQIKEVLSVLLEEEGLGKLKHLLFIGGTPIQTDVDGFRNEGANIVIATPGRLEDLLLRREDSRIAQSVKSLEVLILDEADCLLNLGFEKSLDTILRLLPKQRRTGLFSATQTTEVIKLIRAGLRNPVSIVVRDNDNQGRVPAKLANYYYTVEPEKKFTLLIEFLKQEKSKKVLIFFSTCACVEYFSMVLPRILQCSGGVSNVKSIHGKMKEKHRFAIFNKFRESETGIMCCTDVMARGIDITQKIDWVVQYDPPSHPASFIHRAGRTARNGDEGQALLLLLPSEIDYIDFIKVSQKVDVDRLSLEHLNPSEDQVQQLNKSLKRFQMKDRKYYDKAMRAFVSYYKAYTKYECHLILRHKDLPLSRVAESFGLLKFPKMSEMHGKKPDDFQEVDVDINKLQYGDKLQEKARQKNLTVYKQTGEWPEGKSGGKKKKSAEKSSWATSKEKRVKKKEKKITRKRKRNALTVEEFEELEKDDALVKKLKRKKITEADFDEEIGLIQDD